MTDEDAPRLVLGPLLRYADETAVTVWVETDRACAVEILGRRARTFEVAGHHYGLVVVDGLPPGALASYQVALDGVVRWPEPGPEPGQEPGPEPGPEPGTEPGTEPGLGPSVLRTVDPDRALRLAFGSCRALGTSGPDALSALARGLRGQPPECWPDVLLLIGDQVYADEVGPATREFISRRRDPASPPGYQAADFTEYCFLYREAWSEPSVRWLLSVIPTAMIFDDHDVHDDWNISASWCRDFEQKSWWQDRIRGAYLSYWIYQHLGNLSPDELDRDDLFRLVRQPDGRQPDDAAAALSDFAIRAAQTPSGTRWSFARALGRVRLVVIDSRGGRELDEGKRRMVGEQEWRWVTESVSGDWDHLVIATSLPLLLSRGIHDLEAWNEAVCGGAWGRRFARAGERVRRILDLEHWAAFGRSFADFARLLTGLAAGACGPPPASVTVVSGDVHHSYLAAVDLPAEATAVYQAVCSPMHNMLAPRFRLGQRLISSRPGELIAGVLARRAGVPEPGIRWRITRGPWFSNMLSHLTFDGRAARIRFERAAQDAAGEPRLEPVCETRLC